MSRANPIFRSPFYANPIPSPAPPKRKVVNIPVHFVGPDRSPPLDSSSAAFRIQRAFRGFLVRKNLRAVRKIEGEVEEIVRKIESGEQIERILGDERERLKINEMLMRLLIQLDSVRGVRDYRKKVIRRVISLQESVDAMSAVRSGGAVDQTLQKNESESRDGDHSSSDDDDDEEEALGNKEGDPIQKADEFMETMNQDAEETQEDENLVAEAAESTEMHQVEAVEYENSTGKAAESIATQENEDSGSKADDFMELHQGNEEQSTNLDDPMETPQIVTLENDILSPNPSNDGWELVEEPRESAMEEEEESIEVPKFPAEGGEDNLGCAAVSDSQQESGHLGVKELMEKMAAENEQLKGLVVELCKRSAQQCRLMGGLAERVECLEKMVQKMDKKRKKDKRNVEAQWALLVDKKSGRDDKVPL